MKQLPPSQRRVSLVAWRGEPAAATRLIPEETAIALTYGRVTQAVMMATPADLEDFAIGFSLTEGIVGAASEIEEITQVVDENGIELRMEVAGARMDALLRRRRFLTGATGCGLCGMESLAEAARSVPRVSSGIAFAAPTLVTLPAALGARQLLNQATHAVHAAGFWSEGEGLLLVREDVGRHNALDKLAGAIACRDLDAGVGVLVLTSRVSVEMVQKAAMLGVPLVIAVSAPTSLALRTAEKAGITLVGVARQDGFEVFTHPSRIGLEVAADVG
ncbi:MAG: formate dehydrogenase accessory sulfurtransferase FdhD [Alphaproteobacteria bacterium]|nr:formate dehydrogenase accessory sulfurtransferase FdhD [Alphaproteobacteria bacterium]